MARLLIFVLFACNYLLSFDSLTAQVFSARLVDDENRPIPFVKITFDKGGKSTVANENGEFEFTIGDSLYKKLEVSKFGFDNRSIDISEFTSEEGIFKMKTSDRLKASSKVMGMGPDTLLSLALGKVKENYPTNPITLKGFYSEEIADSKERTLMYGEGKMISTKLPYQNLNSQIDKRARTLLSDIIFEKGFAEYLPVRLKDKHYLKSNYLKREDCTHMIDKSDVLQWKASFLNVEGRSEYSFTFSDIIHNDGGKRVIIKFIPKGKNAYYEGEIIVNLETLAIEECSYSLTSRGLSKINEMNPLIFLINNKRHIVYGKQDSLHAVDQVHFNSKYVYLATGDTLTDRINYVSIDRDLNGDKGFLDNISSAQGSRLTSIPLESAYWGKDIRIKRTSSVEKLFLNNLDDVDVENGFNEASLEFIKAKVKREKKFALIYLQSDACIRCINLDTMYRYDLRYQQAILKDFIPFKMQINDKGSKSLADLSVFPRLGRQVILSPWGQTLNVKPLSATVDEVSKVIYDVVEAVDLSDLYKKISSANVIEDEIQLAGEELLKISKEYSAIQNRHFGRSLLGSKKTWKDRKKRELIFSLVDRTNDKEIQNYFLNHLEEFQNLYTKEELNAHIYSLAFTYPVGRPDFPTISTFLKKHIIGNEDYFVLKAEADFFKIIVPEESIRLEVLIELYQKFQYDEWADFRLTFLEMILAAETQMDFYNLEGIALSYEPYAVEHEWLDLYSVLLYRSGLEEEALKMIEDVLKKAMEKGINYRPAIYGLKEKR